MPQSWLNPQQTVDLWKARHSAAQDLSAGHRTTPWTAPRPRPLPRGSGRSCLGGVPEAGSDLDLAQGPGTEQCPDGTGGVTRSWGPPPDPAWHLGFATPAPPPSLAPEGLHRIQERGPAGCRDPEGSEPLSRIPIPPRVPVRTLSPRVDDDGTTRPAEAVAESSFKGLEYLDALDVDQGGNEA